MGVIKRKDRLQISSMSQIGNKWEFSIKLDGMNFRLTSDDMSSVEKLLRYLQIELSEKRKVWAS